MLSHQNAAIIDTISTIPRQTILDCETPLIQLHALSSHLDIDLWMKRDDVAGPSFGGNKARQLEYYFGAACDKQADTILITGAIQSNFVRLAAACAVRFGMKAIVQLEERVAKSDPTYQQSGNVLLNHLLGADILYYPEGEDENGADDTLYAEAEKLRAQGRTPYVIPLSESKPPLGALGYIRGAAEITSQTTDPFDYVITGSGSGATHLGLAAGMKIYCPSARVIGSCVRRPKAAQASRLRHLTGSFNTLIGCPDFLSEDDIHLWDDALAPGYGQLGPIAKQALQMMAHNEGHILDPVYTAKSFATIPQMLKDKSIAKGSRVLFVHTGGAAGLFAYQTDMQKMLAG
ncbi:MAG: D-cysteine desulfhydrase family protein [Alphaproteobacteria bacterium]|nr:D-cysteine desulfhydrase family protein [Alphaproteobacteria bacterium]